MNEATTGRDTLVCLCICLTLAMFELCLLHFTGLHVCSLPKYSWFHGNCKKNSEKSWILCLFISPISRSLSLHFCDSLGVFSLVLPHCVTLYGQNSGTSLAEWFHLRRFLLLTWHSTSTSYITNLNPFLRLFCSFWRETKKMSFLASQIGNIHHCSWWVLWTSHKLCLHCFLLEKRRKTIW